MSFFGEDGDRQQRPEGRIAIKRHRWYRIVSGAGGYAFNMALDEALLERAAHLGRPILRFYSWAEPAASFGYFQKYAEVEALTLLRPLVRRPTGGGLVPHDADWTYSLVFPTSHEWYSLAAKESYRRVHQWLQAGFAKMNIQTELATVGRKAQVGECFAGYERFDLLWRGRKIAGAAQRRKREGLLVQGSIQPPPLHLERMAWQEAFCDVSIFEESIQWDELPPDDDIHARATTLAIHKYSQPDYNQRR